jgi:hypothetical protein
MVFASPGWRTTGTQAQHFLVAPDLRDRFIDVDLFLGRRFHVDARIGLHLDWPLLPTPLRERRNLEPRLDLVDRVVVLRPIRLGSTDDPDLRRGRVDA